MCILPGFPFLPPPKHTLAFLGGAVNNFFHNYLGVPELLERGPHVICSLEQNRPIKWVGGVGLRRRHLSDLPPSDIHQQCIFFEGDLKL